MKKIIVLMVPLFVALTTHAATGFFGDNYIVGDGGTFFQTTGPDDGINPQLADGFGSLTAGGTFNIEGFEVNTFEDNGSEITHMNLFWTVDSFTNTHQIQIFPAPAKTGNNRLWQITSGTQNLLDNNGVGALANGNYTFQAYFEGYTNATDTPGNIFLSNGGSNYSAAFTVVPEPSSLALLGIAGGVAGLLALSRHRKRS
jgi:hypothetical protein